MSFVELGSEEDFTAIIGDSMCAIDATKPRFRRRRRYTGLRSDTSAHRVHGGQNASVTAATPLEVSQRITDRLAVQAETYLQRLAQRQVTPEWRKFAERHGPLIAGIAEAYRQSARSSKR